MTHASVFSGIGGPEVAATMLGWDNLFHCEINPFGRKVLDYWYPNSKSYEDITTTDFTEWRGRVDVLTGGFPCQPFSYAGRRRGAEDDRYLWPSMYRAIDEIQPTWVVAENVAGILTMVEQGEVSKVAGTATLFDAFDDLRGRFELRETFTLQRICTDLESHGYAVQPVLVPACAVGAPHRRDRVFIVARRVEPLSDTEDDRRMPEGATQCGGERREVSGDEERHEVHDGLDRPCGTAHATDSEHLRLQHDADGGEQATNIEAQSRRGQDSLSESIQCAETVSERESFADTMHERLQRWLDITQEGHGQTEDGSFGFMCEDNGVAGVGRWESFPSVSPVHRGNDGLPFDVDRLTLSFGKWRTEALKAYGNAIVPQVMYEIFRAIEIVEHGW